MVAATAHAHAAVVTVGMYVGKICSPQWGCVGLKVFRHHARFPVFECDDKYKCFTRQQTQRGFVVFAPFVFKRMVCGVTESVSLQYSKVYQLFELNKYPR